MVDRDARLSPASPVSPARLERAAPVRWLEGWTLTLVAAAAVAAIALAIVLAGGADAEAIGLAIRVTARTSFALFTAAFTASALHALWPGRLTRWLRRNRRYLGVAFAASHAVHAAAITALAVLQPAAFTAHMATTARVPGLVGYGLLAAMTITSFDRTAAAIGPRAWKLLHLVGSLYLWGSFFQAFLRRAPHAPAYWLPVAVAVAAIALRVVAWRRSRAARPARLRVTPQRST